MARMEVHNLDEQQKFFDDVYSSNDSLMIDQDRIDRHLNIDPGDSYMEHYAYHLLGDIRNKNILDYGCGTGEDAVILAKMGAKVHAFDISPTGVRIAENRAAVNGVLDKIKVDVKTAGQLDYEDETFDRILGVGIIHHLDIRIMAPEVLRLLRQGGIGVFIEPIAFIPGYHRLTESTKNLVPTRSPKGKWSETEYPLSRKDVQLFCSFFRESTLREFRLVAKFEKLCAKRASRMKLFQIDGLLLSKFPVLRSLCFHAVLKVVK